MRRRASILMEYAIILGVVGAALFTMNIYIKRGVQGRVKDMADYFINNGQEAQVVEIDPEVETTSESSVVSDSTLTDNTSLGGGKQLALLDNTSIEASSVTRDVGRSPNKPDTSAFIPADRGDIVPPDPDAARQQADLSDDLKNLEKQTNIDTLENLKEMLLSQLATAQSLAQIYQTQGQAMINRGNSIHCPSHHGSSCRRARRNVVAEGRNMLKLAAQQRQIAAQLRIDIARVEARIAALKAGG